MPNECVAKGDYIKNYLRSKYLHFAFCILHFAFRASAREIGIYI